MICFYGFSYGKRAVRGALTANNNFGIHHSKHHHVRVIGKKESRSDLIAEISDNIKKKYINKSLKFILK